MAAYMRVLMSRYNRDPFPFHNKRIAFVDPWFVGVWVKDYEQFKIKPERFKFKGTPYEELVTGKLPVDFPTNRKWLQDVDHLYIIHYVGGNHWVTLHVDLWKEKIDCYDSIMFDTTPKGDKDILEQCRTFTRMIPAMMNEIVPHELRKPSSKQFAFRRRKGKDIPQNDNPGDCGVYAAKYVECLALGVTFDGLCDKNIQGLRVKMAAEILDEVPDMYGQFKMM